MEKRLNKKIETYVTAFKDGIRDKINELQFSESTRTNDLIEFVYDYTRLSLMKDDLVKRKRIKNSIPQMNRCSAKRASGEQCTRRRKEGCEFCGTHAKGTPHGLAQTCDNGGVSTQKLEVVAQEVCGIVYYIDSFHNVYNTEDIMEGKQNPRIVAKYENCNGRFSIPELGIN